MYLDPRGANCQDFRKILKGIDSAFEVNFDWDSESYTITFNDGPFQTVPVHDFTRELVEDIRHTFWLNATGQLFDYVDGQNEALELKEERAQTNYAEALAKEMRRPLIESYFYGG
jgi:hypothetical protein